MRRCNVWDFFVNYSHSLGLEFGSTKDEKHGELIRFIFRKNLGKQELKIAHDLKVAQNQFALVTFIQILSKNRNLRTPSIGGFSKSTTNASFKSVRRFKSIFITGQFLVTSSLIQNGIQFRDLLVD